jgi:hypothetical protein
MDVYGALMAVAAMVLAFAIPVVVVAVLVRASLRRLSGRRGRHDRLLSSVARAGVEYSHLRGVGPEVDDIAVPSAPRPGGRGR